MPRTGVGPEDVLVRVRAASVNPVDYKISDGGVKVLIPHAFPLVLGNARWSCALEIETRPRAVRAKPARRPSGANAPFLPTAVGGGDVGGAAATANGKAKAREGRGSTTLWEACAMMTGLCAVVCLGLGPDCWRWCS